MKKKGKIYVDLKSARNTFITNLVNEMLAVYDSTDEAIKALSKAKIAGRSTLYRMIDPELEKYSFPKLDTLVKIANGLGISVVQLVGNARDIRVLLTNGPETVDADRVDNVRDLKSP